MERLFGIETEYAVTGIGTGGAPLKRSAVLGRLMSRLRERFPHVSDGRNGVFLANGARFYIDREDHPEYSTPEVSNPWDAVRYVRAGDLLLSTLAGEIAEACADLSEVIVLRSNVDYSGSGTSWGSHESYLHRSDPEHLPRQIVPHLVSRIVYTGAGGFNSLLAEALQFTLSPRTWHLTQAVSNESTHSRGIFHTKDEPLAGRGWHRLHIICGESLCSELASWLRVGTTALVVAMIEGGVQPGEEVRLRSPLTAMRSFAIDPSCRARAGAWRGDSLTAIDIQRHYLSLAEAHVGAPFMPPWAAEVCRRWREILDRLERGPESVATTLDWAIKLSLYRERARARGVRLESVSRPGDAAQPSGFGPARRRRGKLDTIAPAITGDNPIRQELFEIDTRFAQLGERGIFAGLDRAGALTHRIDGIDDAPDALQYPPAAGRARVRGEQIRHLAAEPNRYICDWHGLWDASTQRVLDLADPFAATAEWKEADAAWMHACLTSGILHPSLAGLQRSRE